MSERLIASIVLLASVYGGVWATRAEHGLVPVFLFLTVISIWTVLVPWDQPEFGDSE